MAEATERWRNRIVGTGEEAPDQLLANPKNWRIHPKSQRQALMAMLDRVGWVGQVTVNRRTGLVVDGHLRVELAITRREATVPVVYVDLDAEEEAIVLASYDPIAAMAGTDDALLQALLAEVSIEDEALVAMFNRLSPPITKTGATDPDDVPEQPDAATTKPGDVWVLGDHRLMCGDSAKPEDLDRLLAGDVVDLFNADPPYNVKVEPRSNNAIAAGMSDQWDQSYQTSLEASQAKRRNARGLHEFDAARRPAGNHQALDLARHPEKSQATHRKLRAKDRPLQGDFITDEDFSTRLLAWFGNASRVMRPGGSFYIWGGYANVANYPPAMIASGLYFSQAVIWVKEHAVLTRKDFMGNHEWCFYGWKEGAGHRFFGPPNVQDVWSVKKVNPQAMVHLTEKPVELARLAITYSSLPGEVVLDLFGGSGSTLIGAEMTGRRARLMEIDALYCDVIVKRWEAFTGRSAVLEAATPETDR